MSDILGAPPVSIHDLQCGSNLEIFFKSNLGLIFADVGNDICFDLQSVCKGIVSTFLDWFYVFSLVMFVLCDWRVFLSYSYLLIEQMCGWIWRGFGVCSASVSCSAYPIVYTCVQLRMRTNRYSDADVYEDICRCRSNTMRYIILLISPVIPILLNG